MTGAAKQPKASKTHQKANQKAGMAVYIDNMSQIPTPCRTIPPPKVVLTHTVQNDQPLKDIKMDTHIAVCMYIRWRVKSASQEKR